jgi:undecaprenyl-diphosphatase
MVLAAVAPAVAGGLTDLVLKPLIDRHIGHGLSFPSGHTTGAFAVAITAAVLLLEGRGIRNPLRVALTVLSLGLAACVAAAVVALGVHYTTDTIGGFCVALGVVLALALVIDEIAERRAQPSASSRNRA